MNALRRLLKRHPRGSALFLAMMMVTLLASMTLFFAERIASNEARQENDTALSYALELAESANDWNVQRVFRDFDAQHDAAKLGDNGLSPIGDSTLTPYAMLDIRLRHYPTTDTNSDSKIDWKDDTFLPATYDYISGTATLFKDLWTSPDSWVDWGPGQVKLSVVQLDQSTSFRYNTVEFKARARVLDSLSGRYIERQVRRVVKYSVTGDNKVFDFAYFANNFGWMYGSPIYIHGNMGSNGNLGFKSGPTVNGMLYAALNPAIGATGSVLNTGGHTDPVYQTKAQYLAGPRGMTAGDQQVLPLNPAYTEDVNYNGALTAAEDVNSNGILDQIDFSLGYKGIQEKMTGQKPLDIPYLGDMNYFKSLANTAARPPRPDVADPGGTGGVIKQLKAPGLDPTVDTNYNYIVGGPGKDAVYGNDADENGKISTWSTSGSTMTVNHQDLTTKLNPEKQERNGNLALIGTPQQPIVISGPVVITGDLVIKGTVKGQGTFYVGRNTHAAGDVVYSDPPTFRNPSNTNNATNINNPNIAATHETNHDKDLVGFAVKGSIVLGQYNRTDDSWSTAHNYFQTGFQNATLQSYQVDPTDAAIGYVTGTTGGLPTFHGNYKEPVRVDPSVEYPSGTVPATLAPLVHTYNGQTKIKLNKYNNVGQWDNGVLPTTEMRYYDSVFPNDYIQAMSTAGTTGSDTATYLNPNSAANATANAAATKNVARRPATLMGIYYTNHLFGGRVGDGTNGIKFFGTMVARDEGVVFNTKCQFVYDPRVADKEPSSHVEIFAPVGTKFEALNWEEMTPGQ
ncbi:MAG: hypothetical protein HS116_20180 [Planctomycetes bacterium]|nr:hypothetical protein [Planctomycetota bacterium]